jgi:hypothetical protein
VYAETSIARRHLRMKKFMICALNTLAYPLHGSKKSLVQHAFLNSESQ